jgi:hypothetical protein
MAIIAAIAQKIFFNLISKNIHKSNYKTCLPVFILSSRKLLLQLQRPRLFDTGVPARQDRIRYTRAEMKLWDHAA